jgi:SAM-dependent methyltransferase
MYDAIYGTFKDFGAEAERVHELVQARRPGARTLLDVGCGTGAHLEHLSQQYEVVGVDLGPEMLAVARERLPGVELREADMAAFDLGRQFDAVVCLSSSIAYVRTLDRLDAAVTTMAAHLAPGGVLVLEPWVLPEEWDPERMQAIFVDEPARKIARMGLSPPLAREQTIVFHYLVATPGGVECFEERHEIGMFEHVEYLVALERAALQAEHVAEGLGAGPPARGLYVGTRGA